VSFNLICSEVKKFHFNRAVMEGRLPPLKTPNLNQTIVSQTTSYIRVSTFHVEQFKNFTEGRTFLGGVDGGSSWGLLPQRNLKFDPLENH